jgi:CubicO group peptidase (beta-lactamase class C family)
LCAEAVRRVSGGKPWAQLCKEWLFDKIGAKTLSFNLPSEETPVALTPQPKETPTNLKTTFGWVAGHPAGGCFGTAEDALKVLHLHLNWGVSGGRRLVSAKALEEMHTVQYAAQIESAVVQGKAPSHETWGLGILLRGKGAKNGGHDWFGFGDQTSKEVFGHAGIDTVIGVADYKTGNALVFISTNSPTPEAKVVPLRNGVTNRVFAALDTLR